MALPVSAETYLIYRDSFPKDTSFPTDAYLVGAKSTTPKSFLNMGYGSEYSKIMAYENITTYARSHDGKLAIWNVVPKTQEESNDITTMLNNGYIVLLSSTICVTKPEGIFNKLATKIISDTNLLNTRADFFDVPNVKLPTDYYTVKVSTPI